MECVDAFYMSTKQLFIATYLYRSKPRAASSCCPLSALHPAGDTSVQVRKVMKIYTISRHSLLTDWLNSELSIFSNWKQVLFARTVRRAHSLNIQLSKSGIADAVASNLYPTIPVPGKWFSCGKEVRFPFYKWLSTIRAGGKIFIRGQSCSLSSDRPQIIPRLYAHTNSRCTPMQVPFFRNFSPLNCSYKARYFWS